MLDQGMTLLSEQSSYAMPDKDCDVVMKGGITSGVVYPLAICRLATGYRLRQIGGTSAGAIAAAAAAAAEFGREQGGFVKFAKLPTWLGNSAASPAKGSNLRNLFQADDATQKTFQILMALIEQGSTPVKVRRLIGRALASHGVTGAIGAGSGAALAIAGAVLGGGAMVPAVVAGGLLGIAGLLAGTSAGTVIHALNQLPQNGFGLCRGLGNPDAKPPTALTAWLSATLDDIAGVHDHPLTFGDLEVKGIRLRMIATSLTHGIPYRLPFDNRAFHYDSAELRQFFPAYVVDHMDAHGDSPRHPLETPPDVDLRHLPATKDLPVVVAARLSLSFPLLISAVPLWAVDHSQDNPANSRAQRNWFSDGGMTSNFPIHFFDGLFPTRPTFAFNLAPTEAVDPVDQTKNIRVPSSAASGAQPRWTDISSAASFGAAILDTMQNWSDDSQLRLPGYRDRIIGILHTKQEGGLNLDMNPGLINALSLRGEAAAAEFLNFDLERHRWTRYRSSMALLEQTLALVLNGYNTPVGGALSYSEMIGDPPGVYRRDWSGPKAAFARERTNRLMALAAAWPDGFRFDDQYAPRPVPVLRVTPDT